MGMWTFLTVPVDARPFGLFHVDCFTQASISLNRKNRNIASAVIRRQHEIPPRTHVYVTWALAERRLLVQRPEFTRSLIHREGRNSTTFLTGKLIHFVDGVQVTTVGLKDQIRRIDYLPGRAGRFQFS